MDTLKKYLWSETGMCVDGHIHPFRDTIFHAAADVEAETGRLRNRETVLIAGVELNSERIHDLLNQTKALQRDG